MLFRTLEVLLAVEDGVDSESDGENAEQESSRANDRHRAERLQSNSRREPLINAPYRLAIGDDYKTWTTERIPLVDCLESKISGKRFIDSLSTS